MIENMNTFNIALHEEDRHCNNQVGMETPVKDIGFSLCDHSRVYFGCERVSSVFSRSTPLATEVTKLGMVIHHARTPAGVFLQGTCIQ